ncbi:putative permease [Parvularcula bermudensis HTCC2503]|uniref:Putative permease n=1 Tax=Parvularcula bermudensis (strain ATCC BAA-594 / HTCC2503 / KCTC 12087) TaxID=314260 RepID=E0TCF9_PARBH|nr:putative permease [Parvularcula bermudensis HTCC2503]
MKRISIWSSTSFFGERVTRRYCACYRTASCREGQPLVDKQHRARLLTLLDRYIFKQVAVPFLLILACTTAVIWFTQMLQRVDLMVEDGGSLLSFLRVTVLLIPSLVGVILPFAVFAAVLYALNLFVTDSELPAMRAAGASRLRLARPVLVLSILAALVSLYINADLQPKTYRQLRQTVEDVRSDIAQSLIREGVFVQPTAQITVFAQEVRPGGQFIGLFINDSSDPRETKTYTAERGLFQMAETGPKLLLIEGTVQYRDRETGRVDVFRYIETAVDLAAFDRGSGGRSLDETERTVSQLLNPDLSDPSIARLADRYRAAGHARLATPLYCPALAVVALCFLLSPPISRRGYGQQVLMAIGCALLLRTGGFLLQGLAADLGALNGLQYIVPLAVILLGSVYLSGLVRLEGTRLVIAAGLQRGRTGTA